MSDPSVDLVKAIAQSFDPQGKDWDAISAVFTLEPGALGLSGYLYGTDAYLGPVGLDTRAIIPALNGYLSQYYTPEDTLPSAMLVQYSRSAGQYNIEFDDAGEGRWQATPDNIQSLPGELFPTFD